MTNPSLSRRDILKLGASLALTSTGSVARATGTGAPTVRTKLDFAVPAHACDAHCHVFDPARFSYAAKRTYSAPPATASDLRRLHSALDIGRTVIVTPSPYGTDNRVTVDAIAQLGMDRARGVALIDGSTSREEIERLDAGGIRAVRVFLGLTADVDPAEALRRFADTSRQISGLPWHLQTYARLPVLNALKTQLADLPVPLVLDHFAGLDASASLDQPGFPMVLDLLRSGRIYIKISGPYYSSDDLPDYRNIAPFARALVAANPERILWGSDWPHPGSAPVAGRKPTDVAPPRDIDDGGGLNRLAEWVPDASTRTLILVDNPQRLFGF
ncbi:amidohydrolase family protein [Paraburkholderia caledonica]|uniref:TIM-barrel fold metal-dependent hydrolase n=1 Tax=Paraburkholderia caledonica TaxID=134536 RepID=A0AB73IM37_9BURK|nr:putative TIM-barrel fold metal-dependent hydrolase [Paraburkholderia caledonica]